MNKYNSFLLAFLVGFALLYIFYIGPKDKERYEHDIDARQFIEAFYRKAAGNDGVINTSDKVELFRFLGV